MVICKAYSKHWQSECYFWIWMIQSYFILKKRFKITQIEMVQDIKIGFYKIRLIRIQFEKDGPSSGYLRFSTDSESLHLPGTDILYIQWPELCGDISWQKTIMGSQYEKIKRPSIFTYSSASFWRAERRLQIYVAIKRVWEL